MIDVSQPAGLSLEIRALLDAGTHPMSERVRTPAVVAGAA